MQGEPAKSESIRGLRFGEIAVKLGFMSPEQLEECLNIQKQMAQMGVNEPVGEIAVKKGYLNQQNSSQILRHMGIAIQPIPGYTILTKLGQGGMGTVYKAKQLSMDRIVALKVLSASATADPNYTERFIREFRSAAKLNHSNIIQAYDAGLAGGTWYFAMELVEGKTCRDIIKEKGPFPEKEGLRIVLQVAEALDYIAANNLIHRDIKPENLMLTTDGTAKICDFGLARSLQMDSSVTRPGFTFGTPYYMSTEQINGDKNLDIRSDIYSLGATLFHMVTGRVPFEGKDLRQVLAKHLTQDVPDPKQINVNVSPETATIIYKMMAKDRTRRYQSPKELIQDLQQVIGGSKPVHAVAIRRAGRRSRVLAIAGLAVLALAIVGTAVLLASRPAEDPSEFNTQVERVQAALNARKWDDVIKNCQKIQSEFSALSAYTQRKSEIQAWHDKALGNKLSDEATSAIQQSDWDTAETILAKRIKVPFPSEEEKAETQRQLESVQKERSATIAWDNARRVNDDQNWPDAETLLLDFQSKFKDTRTFAQCQGKFLAYLTPASKEAGVLRDLKAIDEAAAGARNNPDRWSDVVKLIADLRRFSGSTTLNAASGHLRDLEAEAVGVQEEKARALWEQATIAFKKKDYPSATQFFDALAKSYFATETYARHKQELEGDLDIIRKEEFLNLFTAMVHEKQEYETAARRIAQFQQEFEDRDFVRRNGATLKGLVDRCVQETKKGIVVIDDFEAGPKAWRYEPRRNAPPIDFEESKDAPPGEKTSGRFSWPTSASLAWAVRHLDRKLHPDAMALSFWLKGDAASRGKRVRIQLRTGDGDQQCVWSVEKELPLQWTRIQVLPSEFKLSYSRHEKAPLTDLALVTAIAIIPVPGATPIALYLDMLKVELKTR